MILLLFLLLLSLLLLLLLCSFWNEETSFYVHGFVFYQIWYIFLNGTWKLIWYKKKDSYSFFRFWSTWGKTMEMTRSFKNNQGSFILHINSCNDHIGWRNLEFEGEIQSKQNIFENHCLGTIVGISHMNHIKMDDIRSDLGIPNKIIDIIKKKRLKWFSHIVHKDNAIYISLSHKNNFINRRPRGQPLSNRVT